MGFTALTQIGDRESNKKLVPHLIPLFPFLFLTQRLIKMVSISENLSY